jgi:hypothetical protein
MLLCGWLGSNRATEPVRSWGSWGGHRPSMEGHVTGTGATDAESRRRALILETCSMFLALLMGLLVCCAASAETPTAPKQDGTIYRSAERTTEIKEKAP